MPAALLLVFLKVAVLHRLTVYMLPGFLRVSVSAMLSLYKHRVALLVKLVNGYVILHIC